MSDRRWVWSENGFSLIELLIAAGILLVAAVGLIGMLISAVALRETTRETALASEAARRVMEEMQMTSFGAIFTTHNETPVDDPQGPGTASGMHFDVEGLFPRDGDADGQVGMIIFPVGSATPGLLSESLPYKVYEFPPRAKYATRGADDLGMPLDLNGSGGMPPTDNLAVGYLILPVKVRIEWAGRAGYREFEIKTLIARN